MPNPRDILLQNVQPVIVVKTNESRGAKNSSKDIDYELYSPDRFLLSVAKGQSFALEMLFASDTALINPPHPLWDEIKKNAMQLITRQAASIINYCRQQAYKYCLKGSLLATAKTMLELLTRAEKEHGSLGSVEFSS